MELKRWNLFRTLSPAFASDVRMAMIVGESSEVGILVMGNEDVYSIGSSTSGLLGVEGITSSNIPIKINNLCGKGLTGVSSGSEFVVTVAEDGSVYAWGNNEFGQLGIGIAGGSRDVPQRCSMDGQIISQVACGIMHVLALTSNGKIYAWGLGQSGQTGNGRNAAAVLTPALVLMKGVNDHKVISICCSSNASLALCENGKVWTWGDPVVSTTSYYGPLMIDLKPGIKQVVAGTRSVLALRDNGKLYYWGIFQSKVSKIFEDLGPVLEIAGSWFSETLVFRTQSTVYLCGSLDGKTRLIIPKASGCASTGDALLSFVGITGRPLAFERQENHKMNTLVASLDETETGDVKFIVEGKVIHAHKLLLKTQSEYFHKMFGSSWKENSNDAAIQIENATFSGFRAFLAYLYTGRIYHTSIAEYMELLKHSDFYGEEDLLHRCENILKLMISPENVCELYETAVLQRAKVLEQATVEFVAYHCPAVAESEGFRALSPELAARMFRKLVALGAVAGIKPFISKE